MGVTAIASPIGLPDVCNDRVGMLVLSLQGSDECVVSLDREHLGACLKSKSDRVFSSHDWLREDAAQCSAAIRFRHDPSTPPCQPDAGHLRNQRCACPSQTRSKPDTADETTLLSTYIYYSGRGSNQTWEGSICGSLTRSL